MKGSKFISKFFESYDVTHLFFVPVILPYTFAEIDKNTNIQRIMTHSEKSAVYMADGYARASKKPGVCMAQKVGAANIAAGLRDPFLACSPVVAIKDLTLILKIEIRIKKLMISLCSKA